MKSRNTPITAFRSHVSTVLSTRSKQLDRSQLTRTTGDQACPIREKGEQSVPSFAFYTNQVNVDLGMAKWSSTCRKRKKKRGAGEGRNEAPQQSGKFHPGAL